MFSADEYFLCVSKSGMKVFRACTSSFVEPRITSLRDCMYCEFLKSVMAPHKILYVFS